MIRLIRARFRNFRLLRDIEIEFSISPERPVTVIRAENGTGKTTILIGLTWALFGDEALPAARSAVRLHPINWDVEQDGKYAEVSVEVTFSVEDEQTGLETRYRLIRSAMEFPENGGEFRTRQSSLAVLRMTAGGEESIPNPTAFVAERVLPLGLKDVFFIDGDRALSFIEASGDRSAKRERVESAVRSLLGLDILEAAQEHLKAARRDAVQGVRKEAQGTTIATLSDKENGVSIEIEKCEQAKKDVDDEVLATESRRRKYDDALKQALAAGGADRKRLEGDLSETQLKLSVERARYEEQLVPQHRALLNCGGLLYEMVAPILQKPAELLASLEERKVIPNTLPEVVEDRLSRGVCICGQDVSPGTKGHKALCCLLQEAQRIGESHELLTHLSSTVRRAIRDRGDASRRWSTGAESSLSSLIQSQMIQDETEKREAELRARIRQISDHDIAALDKQVSDEGAEHTRLTAESARFSERLRRLRDDLKEIARERIDIQKREAKYRRRLAQETAANDLLGVIKGTIDALEGETLDDVSGAMNDIFLKMIVADPEQGGIIQRAELTRAHDIVVHGPEGRHLDPDRDLSGAQRRALTLAFILALVKISGVRAPNIVDTPLGMTSGPVRRAMLGVAAENSSQLVLFLTSSEILGVEDILDRYVGRASTLTNTDHYPEWLVNDPGTGRSETLVCGCDYRSQCRLCERVEAA